MMLASLSRAGVSSKPSCSITSRRKKKSSYRAIPSTHPGTRSGSSTITRGSASCVTPIGVEVELHEMRTARMRRLVEALDAHADHEDSLMYPWAQLNLPAVAQRLLVTRIGRWFGGT